MKKSTLLVVLLAIALGASVYFREFRHSPPAKKSDETGKPAFSFQADDVIGLTVVRLGQSVTLAKRDGVWQITQPIDTRADQSVIADIVNGAVIARATRTFSAKPSEMHSYGLDDSALTLDLKLKNGQEHRLRLGATDFSGVSVYALADNSSDVMLVANTTRNRADKPLDELRDRSVLSFSPWDVSAFELKNSSGEISLDKQGTDWKIRQPRQLLANSTAVTTLLSQLSTAKMKSVASETADNLGRYGLAQPSITLQLHLQKGDQRSLLIGSKSGDDYYARDSSRPLIFLVPESVRKPLELKLADLRDNKILHGSVDDFSRIRFRNRKFTLVCAIDKDGKWTVEQPADQKGKTVQSWRIFSPLESAVAKEILDSPPASLAARLAKPAVEIQLTDKSGKTQNFAISDAFGDEVYIRVGTAPSLYRVGKQVLDGFNFKLSDLLQ